MEEYSSTIWNMVPACLMWLIWRQRNTCTFEDVERSVDLLKSLLIGTLSGLVFGVLFNVLPFLISYNLLFFLFDLFVIVSSTVCSLL